MSKLSNTTLLSPVKPGFSVGFTELYVKDEVSPAVGISSVICVSPVVGSAGKHLPSTESGLGL